MFIFDYDPKQRSMDMTYIKNNLISRIKNSNDLKFLEALQTLIDTSEQSSYELSPEQQKSITLGRTDIKNGASLENGQVFSEIRQWLTKK